MSRASNDVYIVGISVYVGGRLRDGYDYTNQAWVVDGKYVRCGHLESMDCGCYGRVHAGEETPNNCGECLLNRVEVVALVNGVCPECGADYRSIP